MKQPNAQPRGNLSGPSLKLGCTKESISWNVHVVFLSSLGQKLPIFCELSLKAGSQATTYLHRSVTSLTDPLWKELTLCFASQQSFWGASMFSFLGKKENFLFLKADCTVKNGLIVLYEVQKCYQKCCDPSSWRTKVTCVALWILSKVIKSCFSVVKFIIQQVLVNGFEHVEAHNCM